MEALDHGILNVPLAKRHDIDRELDAYKAQQARVATAKAKESAVYTAAMRKQAKALVAAAPADLWDRIGKATGLKGSAARRLFTSEAHWSPAKVVAALSREVAA